MSTENASTDKWRDLGGDGTPPRALSVAIKIQIWFGIALLAVVPFLPDLNGHQRLEVAVLLAGYTLVTVVAHLTLGRRDPFAAWLVGLLASMAVTFAGGLLLPALVVAGLLAYEIILAAGVCVAGLRGGLPLAVLASVATAVEWAVHPSSLPSPGFTIPVVVMCYIATVFMVDAFTRERLRVARTLARLHIALRSVAAKPTLDATLDSVVASINDALGAFATIVMLRDGDHLAVAAAKGPRETWSYGRVADVTRRELATIERTPNARAVVGGETVFVRDIKHDDRFPEWCRDWSELFGRLGIESMVAVPLRIGDEVIGVLDGCFAGVGALEADDLTLLRAFAEQVALVIARAQAYAQLEEADRLKSEFLGMVSHELRTPLTAAKGFVDTVLHQWDRLEDAQRRQLLERASGNADALARLITQLLDFSRVDAGKVQLHPIAAELADLVDEVVDHVGPVLGEHPLEVDVPEPLMVVTDRDAFDRVLLNLLTNAAKFSPPLAPITVRARTTPDAVVVSVHDRGDGIASEERERVFERFYQLDNPDTTLRGTGIGLAIVRRFVELQGGRVWVESDSGTGSTFFFTLEPAAAGIPEPAGHGATPGLRARQASSDA